MATTTNYSWTTPDDTALVKDGAAAIRSLGTAIDTTTKNLNPSTTLGDIEYRSSTANTNTRLAIGSTGNVLTVAGGVPTWAAPAGGGKILQVVQGTSTGTVSTTSTSYVDANLTASITPSSASSKILVFVAQDAQQSFPNQTTSYCTFRLVRGSTELVIEDSNGRYDSTTSSTINIKKRVVFSYLDSPATTASTTYKTQISVNSSSTTGTANTDYLGAIILMEVGA